MPVKINGLREMGVNVDFSKVKDEIIRAILRESGELLIKLIRQKAPRDTGAYAQSWQVMNQTTNSITVGTPDEKLALLLEFGTSAHRVDGNDILHFTVNGVDVFVHFSNPGGFPPRRHIKPGLAKFKMQFPEIVQRNIRSKWKIFR